MSTATTAPQLYQLDDATLRAEYVEALYAPLKKFLLKKGQGHCQRVDFLPRPVMEGLAQRLSIDADLNRDMIEVRVVTDKASALQSWEVSGSGAVKLREDATYKAIKVFCALFPSGVRLAEEDSLNVATFKTDDADSFDATACVDQHLRAKVNVRSDEEKVIISKILSQPDVQKRHVRQRLRYVLSLVGQADQSGMDINWEIAGAYLYELDLVPDFGLNGSIVSQQIARNRQCVDILMDGEKSLTQNINQLTEQAELDDENCRKELMVYLADKRTLKAEEWLPAICHDEKLRDTLSFEVWNFSQPVTGLKVDLKPLKDLKSGKPVPGLTEKSGALTSDGKKPVTIKWMVSPRDHEDLGKFRIRVVRKTQDQGEIDIVPEQYISAKRKSFQVPVDENDLGDDEQCVAVIRIQPLRKNGLPFHDEGGEGTVVQDESEEFWIEKGEESEEPPRERGQRIRHLDEIQFASVMATGKKYDIRSQGWDPKRDNVYLRRLTNNRRGDLVLTPLLLSLERVILADPGNLGIYEANLVNKRGGKIEDFKEKTPSPAVSRLADTFFQAREAFFEVVRSLEDGTGVIEIADLHLMRDEALGYVEHYLELLKKLQEQIKQTVSASAVNTTLHDFCDILRIDTIHLKVGPEDKPMEVVLLSPTHPLRVLWLFQYQTLLRGWSDRMNGMKPDDIRSAIDENVLEKLTSLNIPNAIAWKKGKAFINTDNMGLFWGIYPDGELPDLRSAVNAALQGVGATGLSGAITTVTPNLVADKIIRYLCHHPYVKTLKINVINPGDGRLLLEAIKALLGKELYADLNFDLKFFSPKTTRYQLVGTAFDDFMTEGDKNPHASNVSETEQILLSPNANPLFPKLIYGKYTIDELLNDEPGRFSAHLTFVIDFFGTSVSARDHAGESGSSALHNLLAQYVTDYSAGKTTATWSRMIVPSRCEDLASDGNTGRLHETHEHIAHEAACFFNWGKELAEYVTVQLELTDDHGKNHLKMLDKVHEISDWVFTIDRNFGIEYFDDPIQGVGSGSGSYLIDYTPEFLDGVAHRLIISTYYQHEIENILRYGFFELLGFDPDQVGEMIDAALIADVLKLLKSVSGRLALKLINNPSQAQEVIGLALTRLALEQSGRLKGRILIPVDSHIGLFHQNRKELENAELTLKRTDLMLVHLQGRRIHIDLIEVKNRRNASASALVALQDEIQKKNENTEKHFRLHFFSESDRLDAVIKNKELETILAFYFERALRYRLFDEESGSKELREEFAKGLEAVAAGSCEVTFSHEGYIFNGEAYHKVKEDEVHGNLIHHYGRPGISDLLGLALDETADSSNDDGEAGGNHPVTPGPSPTAMPTSPKSPTAIAHVSPKPEAVTVLAPSHTPKMAIQEGRTALEVPTPDEPSTPPKDEAPPTGGANQDEPEVVTDFKVYLGKDRTTSRPLFWDPATTEPKRLLNQHLLIVGKSGSGKSETTKSILYELDKRGVPAIIFDFQGEYATGEFADVVQPQIFDVMEGLPINPFEIPMDPRTGKRRRPVEMMFRLADTLNAVFSGSGDIQLGRLRDAIEECYLRCGFNMQQPAPDDKEPPTLELLGAVLDSWASDRGGQIKNLQVRLQPLFKSGIFVQGKASFNFDDLFKKTSVILLTAGIKDLMLASSRFLLEKIYATMMMQGLSRQLKLIVSVDEAHKLCNDPKITDLAKEARKYGLGLVLSSQETRDFHPSIFANAGTQIVLALEDADAAIMSRVYAPDKKDQAAVKNLIVGQESGVALVRSTHFWPYQQVKIKSFEDRVMDLP